jgi:1,4-alpha-glucan branching enzyme
MSLKKAYSKTRRTCKVTFDLPEEATRGVKAVTLVGDFNNWSLTATPLKPTKDGGFSVSMILDSGREYYFRYCLDGTHWENDWNADKYVPSPFGDSDNSVVIV